MKKTIFLGLSITTLMLSACTNSLNKVTADGKLQEGTEMKWPKISQAWIPEGIFPENDALHRLKPDMTKRQLYRIIERPHFSEMKGAREWNYIMKFRQFDDSVKICQLKVLFDKKQLAQSYHWLPEDCLFEKFDLSAEVLFNFDKRESYDITDKGLESLSKLGYYLKKLGNQTRVHLIGHTDYMGDDKYNQKLSEDRARTVKNYLVQQGVSPSVITYEGRGESEQIKSCNTDGNGITYKVNSKALKDCLIQNRRVTVEINR